MTTEAKPLRYEPKFKTDAERLAYCQGKYDARFTIRLTGGQPTPEVAYKLGLVYGGRFEEAVERMDRESRSAQPSLDTIRLDWISDFASSVSEGWNAGGLPVMFGQGTHAHVGLCEIDTIAFVPRESTDYFRAAIDAAIAATSLSDPERDTKETTIRCCPKCGHDTTKW